MIKKCSIAALMAGVVSAVHATGAGGYFGLMLGQTNLHGENQTFTLEPGETGTVKPDGKGIGTRLFAGYNMNQYAAIEGGFTYYSSMKYNTTLVSNNVKTRAASFDLLGKGMLPLADSGFGVFGKLGGAYLNSKTTGSVEGISLPSSSSSSFRPVVGVGVSYDMTQNWVADLSYTRILYNSSQVKNPDFIALGISYHLLDPKCGQFLC